MTDLDLEAIRKRADAATPGPWSEDDSNIFSKPLSDERHAAIERMLDGEDLEHPDRGYPGPHPLGFVATTTQETPNSDADAEFIAAARADVPALLAEVARLRDLLEKVHGDGKAWRAGKLKACAAADTLEQERDEARAEVERRIDPDSAIVRTQETVARYELEPTGADGIDSGDPLDTLEHIVGAALATVIDERDETRTQLAEAVEALRPFIAEPDDINDPMFGVPAEHVDKCARIVAAYDEERPGE